MREDLRAILEICAALALRLGLLEARAPDQLADRRDKRERSKRVPLEERKKE